MNPSERIDELIATHLQLTLDLTDVTTVAW